MKRIMLVSMLILIPATLWGASLKTSGNKDLNRYLEGLSRQVSQGQLTRTELSNHVSAAFGVDRAGTTQLERAGIEPGEIYLAGLIHKTTGSSIASILATKRGGRRSWADVSYFLGSTPNELNSLRLADEKSWRRGTPAKVAAVSKPVVASSSSSSAPAAKPVISNAAPVSKTMKMTSDGVDWDCSCRRR